MNAPAGGFVDALLSKRLEKGKHDGEEQHDHHHPP
jgi:hypothetical protein